MKCVHYILPPNHCGTGEPNLTIVDGLSVSADPPQFAPVIQCHFQPEVGFQTFHHASSNTDSLGIPRNFHYYSFASYYIRSITWETKEWMRSRPQCLIHVRLLRHSSRSFGLPGNTNDSGQTGWHGYLVWGVSHRTLLSEYRSMLINQDSRVHPPHSFSIPPPRTYRQLATTERQRVGITN